MNACSLPFTPADNQILSILKLIHLATILDRVPILPSLSGVAHNEGLPIPLSTFYKLTRLSSTLSRAILEWSEVKNPLTLEPLGCWRTVPRGGGERSLLDSGLEPQYWPFPEDLGLPTFDSLAALVQSPDLWEDALAAARDRIASQGLQAPTVEPQQHLVCFDQHLRTWEARTVNGERDKKEALQDLDPEGPTWLNVGQHLHWSDHLVALAEEAKVKLLGAADRPYIGVHIRQGDFIKQGRTEGGNVQPFVDGVQKIQAQLVAERGARWRALPVVFATDSVDEALLQDLRSRGWLHLDHAVWRTKENLGGWYPAHLDLSVLSGASAFVG